MNECFSVLVVDFRKPPITAFVFLHWFAPVAVRSFWLILSRTDLLTRPRLLLAGFISLQFVFFGGFSLWSLSVIKARLCAMISAFLPMSCLVVTYFSSCMVDLVC